MKKIILYIAFFCIIILIVFFIYNYKPNTNDLRFAYEEHMKLDKDEIVIDPITKDISEQFYIFSYVKGSDIALNKAVKGKNLSFISVSLKLNSDSFKQLQDKDTSFIKIFEKKYNDNSIKRKYFSFYIKKSGMFVFRTVYNEPDYNDLIVYDILNKDSLKILKYYQSETYILKKIRD